MYFAIANSLDPDQAQQNVGPDLDPDCLTLWKYSRREFFEKVNVGKKSADKKYLASKELY